MAQKFTISTAENSGGFLFIGKKFQVNEELFYSILEKTVKTISAEQPEKFEECFETCKEAILEKNLTVLNINFEIKGKP